MAHRRIVLPVFDRRCSLRGCQSFGLERQIMHIDTGSRKQGPWGCDGSVIYNTEGHLKHFPGSDRRMGTNCIREGLVLVVFGVFAGTTVVDCC